LGDVLENSEEGTQQQILGHQKQWQRR